MTKDEAITFMIHKVEEIERERITANFSIDANKQKKETVEAIVKAIREVKFEDENNKN